MKADGAYHVDDQEGLNVLAKTIRELVSRLSNAQRSGAHESQ